MNAPCVLSPRNDKIVQYFDVSVLDFKRNPKKECLNQINRSVYKDELQKMQKIEDIPLEYEDITAYTNECERLYNLHKDKSKMQNIKLKQFGTLSKMQKKNAKKCIENMINTVLMGYNNKIHYKKQQYLSFMTLTLPLKQAHSDKVFRKMLTRFIENLQKTYKVVHYVWRAEPQKNGNIHFHVLLDRYVASSKVNELWCKQLEKKEYISKYQQRKNTNNLPPATEIKSLRKIKNTSKYLLKYMTKRKKGERAIIGQLWGASNITKKLDYPKFYDSDTAFRSLEMMIRKQEVKASLIDDFFAVYVGDVYNIIKKKYYSVWRNIKAHYKSLKGLTLDKIKEWADNPIVSHKTTPFASPKMVEDFYNENIAPKKKQKITSLNPKVQQLDIKYNKYLNC